VDVNGFDPEVVQHQLEEAILFLGRGAALQVGNPEQFVLALSAQTRSLALVLRIQVHDVTHFLDHVLAFTQNATVQAFQFLFERQ